MNSTTGNSFLIPTVHFNPYRLSNASLVPTKPARWWAGGEILGGQDEVGGGTWLACSRQGRVAFLTNVLELHTFHAGKSRGNLPLHFLQSKKSPKEFAEGLVREAKEYNGFNLIMADVAAKSMVYFTNRPKGETVSIREVNPGIHVLCNATLNTPWPKVERLRKNFKVRLGVYGEGEIPVKEMVEKLMRDTIKADEDELPHICSLDWEFSLSSIFVQADTPRGRCGTRSTAALTVGANGEASFYETYLEREGIWREQTLNYHIQKV